VLLAAFNSFCAYGTHTGLFVSMYKFVLNALPLLIPAAPKPRRSHSRLRRKFRADYPVGSEALLAASANPFEDEEEEEDLEKGRGRLLSQREARLSLSTQEYQRKKTKRWYSIVAGALAGGAAILCEKKGRRVTIAQQLFVRCVLRIYAY
jgi:hypothetical protein